MILDDYKFQSCFAPYIYKLLDEKHDEGFLYDTAKYTLIRFDKFCLNNRIKEPVITREVSLAWSTTKGNESRSTVGSRMSVLRQLALYMCSNGIDCYLPSGYSDHSHSIAYVLEEDKVQAFFKEVDNYISGINADRFNRLGMEYKVLFRVIFCCGLRVSEARKLTKTDVDLSNGRTIIRESKGHKDRIVFLPADLCGLCSQYISLLKEKYGVISDLIFPAADPSKELCAASINQKFCYFWDRTSYAGKDNRHPTVHSLRHSFVVIRMNKWMEQGVRLNGMMPYLSRYLGHTSVEDTFYYYHQVSSAFRIIKEKDIASTQIIPEVAYEE